METIAFTKGGSTYIFIETERGILVWRNYQEQIMIKEPIKIRRFHRMMIVGYRDWEKKKDLVTWNTSMVVKVTRTNDSNGTLF